MKASELIVELRAAIEKFGDLEVFSTADWEVVDGVDMDDDHDPFINEETKERMIVLY